MSRDLLCLEDSYAFWDYCMAAPDYHAMRDHVSSSGLREILESPYQFKMGFLRGRSREPTPAMINGIVVHEAVLEGKKFLEHYAVMPDFTEGGKFHPNSNNCQIPKKAWIEEHKGRQVVTAKQLDDITAMIEAILENQDAAALLSDCQTEVSGFFVDEKTRIRSRIRLDTLSKDGEIITDIKTTRLSMRRFKEKGFYDDRYDFQLTNYCAGAKAINGKAPRWAVNIVVQNEYPYETAVFVLETDAMQLAEDDYRYTLDVLRKCIDRDHFPRRYEGITPIAQPMYAIKARDLENA